MYKQYLFGLLFSRNVKKTDIDRIMCNFFTLSEKKGLTNLQK